MLAYLWVQNQATLCKNNVRFMFFSIIIRFFTYIRVTRILTEREFVDSRQPDLRASIPFLQIFFLTHIRWRISRPSQPRTSWDSGDCSDGHSPQCWPNICQRAWRRSGAGRPTLKIECEFCDTYGNASPIGYASCRVISIDHWSLI